jgi:elongation factor 1-beta
MSQFTGLATPAGLGKLNSFLANESYIAGYQATQADLDLHKQIKPDSFDHHKFAHLARWYKHVATFTAEEVAAHTSAAPKKEAAAPAAEDDFDVFGEMTEDEAAKKAENEKKAADEKAAKKKPAVIGRSTIILDVKPWEADEEGSTTIMDEIDAAVRSITQEGLEWKAKEIIKIGFGICKLRIMANIVDDLVSVDAIIEQIQDKNEELVQSVDIFDFTKLSGCRSRLPQGTHLKEQI